MAEPMPDGSAAVFDTTSEAVHSLNPLAKLAWDCCAQPATVTTIAETLQGVEGIGDARATAETALAQLLQHGLVEPVTTAAAPERARDAIVASPSRRAALRLAIGGPAVAVVAPLVLSMTLGEQQLHAFQAGSPAPTPTPSPTGGPSPSPTPSPTPTSGGPTPTPSPTSGPTPTPSVTPTATPTPTLGPTPTVTPTPTTTPTPTVTPTPTTTPTPTVTPTPTTTPTPTPTPTATPTPTPL